MPSHNFTSIVNSIGNPHQIITTQQIQAKPLLKTVTEAMLCLFTLNFTGLRRLLRSQAEQQKEIINACADICYHLPKTYQEMMTEDRVLHTNFAEGFQICQESDEIVLYEGRKAQTKGSNNNFTCYPNSRTVIKFFRENEYKSYVSTIEEQFENDQIFKGSIEALDKKIDIDFLCIVEVGEKDYSSLLANWNKVTDKCAENFFDEFKDFSEEVASSYPESDSKIRQIKGEFYFKKNPKKADELNQYNLDNSNIAERIGKKFSAQGEAKSSDLDKKCSDNIRNISEALRKYNFCEKIIRKNVAKLEEGFEKEKFPAKYQGGIDFHNPQKQQGRKFNPAWEPLLHELNSNNIEIKITANNGQRVIEIYNKNQVDHPPKILIDARPTATHERQDPQSLIKLITDFLNVDPKRTLKDFMDQKIAIKDTTRYSYLLKNVKLLVYNDCGDGVDNKIKDKIISEVIRRFENNNLMKINLPFGEYDKLKPIKAAELGLPEDILIPAMDKDELSLARILLKSYQENPRQANEESNNYKERVLTSEIKALIRQFYRPDESDEVKGITNDDFTKQEQDSLAKINGNTFDLSSNFVYLGWYYTDKGGINIKFRHPVVSLLLLSYKLEKNNRDVKEIHEYSMRSLVTDYNNYQQNKDFLNKLAKKVYAKYGTFLLGLIRGENWTECRNHIES